MKPWIAGLAGAGLMATGALAGETAPAAVRPEDTPRTAVADALAAMPRTHPRLFGGPEAFARLRAEAERTPEGAAMRRRVLADAEAMLAVAPVAHVLEGRRLLDFHGQVRPAEHGKKRFERCK